MANQEKIKRDFLHKVELFYRNFGNEWSIDDFELNQKKQKYLLKVLIELNEMKIIKLNEDGKSFKIIDLPSNHINFLLNE